MKSHSSEICCKRLYQAGSLLNLIDSKIDTTVQYVAVLIDYPPHTVLSPLARSGKQQTAGR